MKKACILSLAIACLAGCKKNGGDTEKPVIYVTSPTANQHFYAGQTVNIAASITDNEELHEVHLTVIDKGTNSEVIHYQQHVDVRNLNIDRSFITTGGTKYKIRLEAEDHTGNYSDLEFEVSCN